MCHDHNPESRLLPSNSFLVDPIYRVVSVIALTLKVAWVVGLMSSKMTWFWRCHSSSFSLAWVAALALASALKIRIHKHWVKTALFLDKRVGLSTHKTPKQDKNPIAAQLVNKSHTKDDGITLFDEIITCC